MYFLSWIIVGLVAGWSAGKILKGNTYGPFMDIAMGIYQIEEATTLTIRRPTRIWACSALITPSRSSSRPMAHPDSRPCNTAAVAMTRAGPQECRGSAMLRRRRRAVSSAAAPMSAN